MIVLMSFSGEALGAIGCSSVIDLLAEYTKDPVVEVKTLIIRAIGRFF